MSGILRLENLNKGTTLKQGDKTVLSYRLSDADGEQLDIAGKTAVARLMHPDFTRIGYESEALTVSADNTVQFSIDSIIPSRLYYLEITVDGQYIFPSRSDEGKLSIDRSSMGAEITIIENAGIDAVVRKAVDLINEDPSLIIDEDKLVSDIISNTGIGSINDYYKAFDDLKPKAELSISRSIEALTKSQNALNVANGIDAKATNALSLSESADTLSKSVQEQFNQVVIDGDSSVEAAQARVDASGQTNPTLKARLDKEHNEVTTQLAHKANKESVDFRQTSGKGTKEKDPTVIFVSDDVRLQDKSLLLPIMQRYNIPFVTAMSPYRNINRHEFGNVYLTVDEAKELQDIHGWEIVSHTWNHEHLPQLTDEELDFTLRHSREWLIENGFNGYDFLMYPFGEYDERVKRVTAKYYKAARTTGTPNYPPENKYPLSNYQLSTRFISRTVSLDHIKDDVSRLIRDDGLLIIFFHGQEIETWGREEFLEEVVSYVKSEETAGKLKIKNFRQTFETQENIIDQVSYTDKYDDQFVIGANGKVQSNIARTKLLKPNSVTATTPPELYPHDFISMCTITNTTGGFPILGTLVTHRFSNNENTIANYGYTHQTLYGYNSPRVMTRSFMGGTWTPFTDLGGSSGGGIITGSGYNGETSPAIFNLGISYHTIGSGSAGMPTTTGGIMKTVKVASYDFWYQEFKPTASNDLWRRYANSGTTWGAFVKVTSGGGTSTPAEGQFTIITGSTVDGDTPPNEFPESKLTLYSKGTNTPGMPTTIGGILSVYKVSASYSFWYQEYKASGGNRKWRRYATSQTAWSPWQLVVADYGGTRPTSVAPGFMFFDAGIGKPIWLKSEGEWVDATGATV